MKLILIVSLMLGLTTPDSSVMIAHPPPPIPETVLVVPTTAYCSTPEQTDDSPWITATGDSVFWGGVAVSKSLGKILPIGTIINIEGYKTPFVVFDATSDRWLGHRLDIWFPDLRDAIEFGLRKLKITKIGTMSKEEIKNFSKYTI